MVPFRWEKKEKKIVIVNLRRKKKPHTQGKKSPDASAKMPSPFPTGLSASWYRADTPFLKCRRRTAGEGPDGSTGERGRNGDIGEWRGG